ncbi:hypothetical protein [Rhodococcus sp. USK13]|uniref:hypothetical protein n=1 Tax=Rhodococcus sp. USK13 TaxID=2806442 RepID=UPI001BCF236C|nr:hypothetical protein [Rhodococcus sp. USK13]
MAGDPTEIVLGDDRRIRGQRGGLQPGPQRTPVLKKRAGSNPGTALRAEDHHDIELIDAAGHRLSKGRLPEGAAPLARLHALIGDQPGDADESEVAIGIETDRGP